MSLSILVDMNLSPEWVPRLQQLGWPAIHWSSVGMPEATDQTIMDWADANGHIVFTHDLDFGTMLALTHQKGPSVIQVRGSNVLPDQLADVISATLKQHEVDLANGALIVIDESRKRVRILPI